MQNVFECCQNVSLKKPLIYSGILTAIVFLALRAFGEPLITPEAPGGIISFELAKTLEQSQLMLASWDTNAKINAGLSTGIDFLFLMAYGFFFALLCITVAKRFRDKINWLYKTGIYLAALQIIAALFDAIENIALIKLLLGSQNCLYSSISYYFASFKFIFILLGFIYIIVGFVVSFFINKK